mgnify:FL=1
MSLEGALSLVVESVQHPRRHDLKELQCCANFFRKAKLFDSAREMLRLLHDLPGLARLYVDFQRWDEALAIVEEEPDNEELVSAVNLPYAEWLITQDRFEDAQQVICPITPSCCMSRRRLSLWLCLRTCPSRGGCPPLMVYDCLTVLACQEIDVVPTAKRHSCSSTFLGPGASQAW